MLKLFEKIVTGKRRHLFSQKTPLQVFCRVLNTALHLSKVFSTTVTKFPADDKTSKATIT